MPDKHRIFENIAMITTLVMAVGLLIAMIIYVQANVVSWFVYAMLCLLALIAGITIMRVIEWWRSR